MGLFMNGAELKATLKSGGRVFGTMLSLSRNPKWIAELANVGLDYVVIDTEHGARSRGELADFFDQPQYYGSCANS